MTRSAYRAPAAAVLDWIRSLAASQATYFPARHGAQGHRFVRVGLRSDLSFGGYRPTVVPPGKKLSPAREELFRFGKGSDGRLRITPTLINEAQVLAGVRPCDLKGIALMDRVNGEGEADPNYAARRSATAIIAYACSEPCDESCFCESAGSLDFEDGADVLLTPVDGDLLIEPRSDTGEALLDDADFAAVANADALKAAAKARRPSPFGRQLEATTKELPEILARRYTSEVWERHVKDCFSCGTCNVVCPTCYCFDVHDDIDVNAPSSGRRWRTWDACMLPAFAVVAGGHNFRADPAARQRHRVKRKFEYLTTRHGQGSFCVGCGRCGRQCTADIDIFDIVNDVVRDDRSTP